MDGLETIHTIQDPDDAPVRSSGSRWSGLLVERGRVRQSGEIAQRCALSHLLWVTTALPKKSELLTADAGWERLNVPRNTVHFLPARMPHASRWEGAQECVVVQLTPGFVDSVQGPERNVPVGPTRYWRVQNNLLLETILALERDFVEGSPAGPLFGECLGAALVATLIREHTKVRPGGNDRRPLPARRLACVVEYINDNPAGDLSLLRMAAMAGLGVDHFMRLFKQQTGFSPHQYVLHKRVERAKSLMANRHLSITEIASRTGFLDLNHFGKCFRRLTGVNPRTFRDSV